MGHGKLSSQDMGLLQGSSGHLAGPDERKFLSFILLINAIYFTVPAQAVALLAPACQGSLRAGDCHTWPLLSWGMSSTPGWVGGTGRMGRAGLQAGMCWQGPCLLPRSSCGPKQQGPCWCTGRATFPAPRGAVMWLHCRPWWAGGFLPCTGWLGPAFDSSALHPLSASEKQPCVHQHARPVAPPATGNMACGASVPFAAGEDRDSAFLPPLPVV